MERGSFIPSFIWGKLLPSGHFSTFHRLNFTGEFGATILKLHGLKRSLLKNAHLLGCENFPIWTTIPLPCLGEEQDALICLVCRNSLLKWDVTEHWLWKPCFLELHSPLNPSPNTHQYCTKDILEGFLLISLISSSSIRRQIGWF